MNEVPRSFRPVEGVMVSEAISPKVVEDVTRLKRAANDHEDFEILEQFMNMIADFKSELLQTYTEDELSQVPLYHHLIGSGMAEGTSFITPISENNRIAIETAIVDLVNDTLLPLLAESENV